MPKQNVPEAGLVFPKDPKKPSAPRGSTYGNTHAWASAIRVVNKLDAEKILSEKNWRANYPRHILRHVQQSLKSRDNALNIANAGLKFCYENFEFVRDSKSQSLENAMATYDASIFETGFVQGNVTESEKVDFKVPYGGKNLSGADLIKQLDKWANYGTIEPSTRDAIAAVVQHREWLDLSDMYFCLLGAGSAMGPFLTLIGLGANIIAIDLDRPNIWKRLISVAKNSPGTLTFPMKGSQKGLSDDEVAARVGCNLFTETPEIRNWLLKVHPNEKMIVGAYAYLDGELHVKVSLAMDAIIRDMSTKRKAGAAYLCTPTDVHVIPKDARDAAIANYDALGLSTIMKPFLVKNAQTPVKTNDGHDEFCLVNGIVGKQGPNYALAKRIQHWRAIVAREEAGVIVSSNIAPSTSTASVVSNKLFAMAYGGMHHFKPMEVSTPETSNAVMAALLIHDVRNKDSVSHPSHKLKNPYQLMSYGSFHGGVWRAAFSIESLGTPSLLIYLASRPFDSKNAPVLLIGLALAIFAVSFTNVTLGSLIGFGQAK